MSFEQALPYILGPYGVLVVCARREGGSPMGNPKGKGRSSEDWPFSLAAACIHHAV